ncbi:hypothetical protein PIB30_095126 [Stylosanthes scabra]|uniref:Uncharacterized protein n=1 Tax=Stylosanthes scabra TaxID=79078 RepID=A0ABU6TWA0_9FABA|nr:hypothetical protein [Stylosanthes scabra]
MTNVVTTLTRIFVQQTSSVFPVFNGLSPSLFHSIPPPMHNPHMFHVMPPQAYNATPTTTNDTMSQHSLRKHKKVGKPVTTIRKEKYVTIISPDSKALPRRNSSSKIPEWVPIIFRPSEDTILTNEEVHLAAFIFGPKMSLLDVSNLHLVGQDLQKN